MAVFLVALVGEYGFFHRLLRDALRTRDIARVRPAVNRWLIVTIVWQLLVVAGCVLYLIVLGPRHGHSAAWVSPAVGAALGIAVPLQFIAMAIVRSLRGSI